MLEKLLTTYKDQVLQHWYEHVVNTYPAETGKFLKTQKDRFANPVGASISEGLQGLYESLTTNEDLCSAQTYEFLDRLIRVRAVQDFSPSQAVHFIFGLKGAVRTALKKELADRSLLEELLTFESRIDTLALLSFDLYVHCRETLFQIRCNEIKNSTARTWERICRKYGEPDTVSEPPEHDSSPR